VYCHECRVVVDTKYNLLEEKRCRQCGRIRSISEFGKTASSRDGYYKECLECQDENKQRIRERKNKESWDGKTYVCRICGLLKPSYEFSTPRNSSRGYEYCRLCIARMCRAKYHRFEQERERYGYPLEKRCKECGRVLPSDRFILDRCYRDGLGEKCRECSNEQRLQWIKKEAEKRLRQPLGNDLVKECTICHQVQPLSKFTKDMSNKDGRSLYCVRCSKKIRQEDARVWARQRKADIKKGKQLVEMQCRICKRVLPIEQFSKNKYMKSGYYTYCTDCHKQLEHGIELEWEQKRKNSLFEFSLDVKVEKKCKSCQRVLPLSMFWKRRASKDGRSHYCTDCYRKNLLKRRAKLKKRGIVPERIPATKYCPGCHRTLPHDAFRFDSTSGDCLDGQCKECRKKYYAEYYARPEVKQMQRERRQRPEVKERHRITVREAYHRKKKTAHG
jgi:hypothetical protein